MYGDLGVVGGILIFFVLFDDVIKNNYDVVWYVGDFGYDFYFNGGKVCILLIFMIYDNFLIMSCFFLINFFEFFIINNFFIIGR